MIATMCWLIVDDQAAGIRRLNQAGHETVTDAEGAGIRFVMAGTVREISMAAI
jgi:hypothetical protein